MKKDSAASLFHPDLFVPPHVLPLLLRLCTDDNRQAFSQQEHLLTHLVACHYCRTAVVFLLNILQDHDHGNNEEPAHDLFARFADIGNAIEVYKYEQMGAYAEAIVAQGREKADLCFPNVTAYLRTHPDHRSMLEATVASIIEPEETN